MEQSSGKINSNTISLTPNAVWITVLVFLSLVLLATPASQVYNSSSDEALVERYEAHIVQTMNSSVLQKGGRYIGALVGYGVDSLVKIFADIFRTPDKNYFNKKSTDLTRSNIFMDTEKQDATIIFLADCAYRILILLPFLFISFLIFESVYSAIIFLTLISLTLSGYGAFQEFLAVDVFSWLKVNQWHPFWEFQGMLPALYFDYFTIGFLGVLALIMILGKADHLPTAAIITAIGQLSYLHLGFVAGVSLALFVFFTTSGAWRRKIKKAVYVLIVCGLTSIIFAIMHGGLVVLNVGTIEFASGGGAGFSLADMTDHAAPNRENYKHVLFRLSYFHAVPLIIGALTGFIVAGYEKVTGKKPASNVTPISFFCLLTAFLMATAVGFLFATDFSAERGREFLPAACLAIVLGFTTMRWAFKYIPVPRLP